MNRNPNGKSRLEGLLSGCYLACKHVTRLFAAFLPIILLARGAGPDPDREDIVLTGGPALRFTEYSKSATLPEVHDAYWFNFVDASSVRLRELKERAGPAELVTWLVYRPAYMSRGNELDIDLLAKIEKKAQTLSANLQWFDTQQELINYLNAGLDRSRIKISDFDYFGHSNKSCFFFDYNNAVRGMSIAWLDVRDLRKITENIFAPEATCKSWGCFSGQLYSKWWTDRFAVPLTGANGKTDYEHGGLPRLSNWGDKWVH